jgi:lipopolysaccharide/colanic/teichoic acid biosynthesis glycosyltransferase
VNATDRLELVGGMKTPAVAAPSELDADYLPVADVSHGEPTPLVGRRAPAWLSALETWHRAVLHPVPLLVDGLLVGGAFLNQGSRLSQAITVAIAFVILSPVLGLAARRSTLEAQGVRWYARAVVGVDATLVLAAFTRPFGLSPRMVAQGLVVAAVWLLILRGLAWMIIGCARRRGIGLRPTLVIGTQGQIAQLAHRLATYPEAGLRFAAGYTPTLPDTEAVHDGHAQAFSLLGRDEVDHVLFVSDGIDEDVFREFVYRADSTKAYSLVLPLPHLSSQGTPYHLGDLGVLPLPIGVTKTGMITKRAFDVVVSALLLLLTAPIIGAACLATWLYDRGPGFFYQQRVGRDGKSFTMYKLRSMVVGADNQRDEYVANNINNGLLFKLRDDPRITPVGTFIRRLSIDELPQLLNVLKGDMSLVGPRPLPVAAEEFDQLAMARHAINPGITGLWQVEGANALPYHDMIDLDLIYVITRSFRSDLSLLARTLPALLIRRSAY